MLYFVKEICADTVVCTDGKGRKQCFLRALFPDEVAPDLPVIQWADGRFTCYNGAFKDDEGNWRQLVAYLDEIRLEIRRAPLSDEEIKAFLQQVTQRNSRELLPAINLLIDDLLQQGRIELANFLIEYSFTLQ